MSSFYSYQTVFPSVFICVFCCHNMSLFSSQFWKLKIQNCLVLWPLMQVPMAISWHGKKVEGKLSPCTGWPHITMSQLRTLIPRNSLHKHGSLLKTTFLIILQPVQLLKSPPHQKYTDFWETNSNHSTEFKVLHIFLSRIMLHSRSPLLFNYPCFIYDPLCLSSPELHKNVFL